MIRRGRRGGQQNSSNASQRTSISIPNGENTLQVPVGEGNSCRGGQQNNNNASQRTSASIPNSENTTQVAVGEGNDRSGAPQQRGRKRSSRTQLHMPPRAGKILIKPQGDEQFKYVNYQSKKEYAYHSQLGVILKHEYPGVVEDIDDHGNILNSRAALTWEDYYVNGDDEGVTAADRVKREFWHLFKVERDDEVEADRVFENYVVGRVKNMMYQARVDAVKLYYQTQGEVLDDLLARPKELQYNQYMAGRVWWCNEQVWPYLCRYWCSDRYKAKRKRGQEARLKSNDTAQNRGGSRPYAETKQYLEYKYGPEKATDLNTYAVMKSGIKNVDSSSGSGPVCSQKAQKHIDDYTTAAMAQYPDDWEQRPLEPTILYNINGGLPHGRVAIANGAIKKSRILLAAKARNIRPSNTVAFHSVLRQNQELVQHNQELVQRQELHSRLILRLCEKLGEEVPPEMMSFGSTSTYGQQGVGTGSSHAESHPGENIDVGAEGNITGDGDHANNGDNGSGEIHDGNHLTNGEKSRQ